MLVRKKNDEDDFKEVEIDCDEPIYTSSVVCNLLGVPYWVLKQLDTEGIVSPPRKRGRARLYSKRELKKIKHCWFYMEQHKVKVQGLKVILQMEEGTFKAEAIEE